MYLFVLVTTGTFKMAANSPAPAPAPPTRDFLMDKIIDLKKVLNEKFNGGVRSSVELPCVGQTRSVTFTVTINSKDVHMGTVYLRDRNDGFKKGDIVKNDNTVAFNLVHENDIPTKVNLHCFTPTDGLKHLSNFRVGYNAAKAEGDVAITKVQGETAALKEEIETLKNTLSGIHTLSAPPAPPADE
jgi:hypothetical protein